MPSPSRGEGEGGGDKVIFYVIRDFLTFLEISGGSDDKKSFGDDQPPPKL